MHFLAEGVDRSCWTDSSALVVKGDCSTALTAAVVVCQYFAATMMMLESDALSEHVSFSCGIVARMILDPLLCYKWYKKNEMYGIASIKIQYIVHV